MEKEYTILMKRTYVTEIKVTALNEHQAIDLAAADEERYNKELSQCNVVEETYKVK